MFFDVFKTTLDVIIFFTNLMNIFKNILKIHKIKPSNPKNYKNVLNDHTKKSNSDIHQKWLIIADDWIIKRYYMSQKHTTNPSRSQ